MTACTRFEREGILLLEQGQPLDDHFDTCEDCRAARVAYEQTRRAMAHSDSDPEPSPDWQRRVWETIDRKESAPHWIWSSAAAAAAVATVVAGIVVARLFAPVSPTTVAIRQAIVDEESSGDPFRGGGGPAGVNYAQPGQWLVLSGVTGGATEAELRLYRWDSELIFQCSTEPPCVREADEIRARYQLEEAGNYQPLLLLSDAPIPAGSSGLDEDTGVAREAGARVLLGEDVIVR